MTAIRNVLFLCTGNSARSILAEAILTARGAGRFRGFSAGSHPSGAPHPRAIALLDQLGHDTSGLRSKSWDEFAEPDAPKMAFIITVCDNAAGEVCPVWPGRPATAHWGLPDPAAVTGSDAQEALAFAETYRMLTRRIDAFTALPLETLDAMSLQSRLDAIGRDDDTRIPAR
ncbi:arsenate reductase ArsC [Roseovarius sp. SCSIO 43702]|uniref:arsenate reductase ArsC n=1 Tax=Roseovarius sp. SCSIO 43702 TaxID=2823043 RepID=UPI001C72FE08|nr:arsenate reductase ArsC [Roseovarius sp. SCSIO 43702]QYX55582.1 arsenate reductase ArsC [Roseovarius sp. SCSIO 43702]